MIQLLKNKLLKFRYLNLIILTSISHSGFSQIFSTEQNPLSVKWRQINNKGFKIIYPTELEKEAQRMANTIGFIFPYDGASLGVRKTTLPIVLQNRGVIANGFVQLGPKKSEFYTTPPQVFDSQDWLNNLAIHELRHAAQYDKLTHGKASAPKLPSLMPVAEGSLPGSCPTGPACSKEKIFPTAKPISDQTKTSLRVTINSGTSWYPTSEHSSEKIFLTACLPTFASGPPAPTRLQAA